MFLDQVQKLGLLEHDVRANVLRDFPLSVRKVLVENVVGFLLSGASPTLLCSPAHVEYALETCGQGFTLPIEQESIILQVIELYRTWILDAKRPPPVSQDPQHFTRTMLKHYSLMFKNRTDTLVSQHAALCSRVLDIFVTVGRVQGSQLDRTTWEVFLRLMIGIADSLFTAPSAEQELGRKLCKQTLSVLFELWLHSQTRNPEMWEALRRAISRWTSIMQVVHQWNATVYALTNRTLCIMYGEGVAGTDAVLMRAADGDSAGGGGSGSGSATNSPSGSSLNLLAGSGSDDELAGSASLSSSIQRLQLDDEFVCYAWHRMLHILGDPNKSLTQPKNFVACMAGVERVVQLYLRVRRDRTEASATGLLPPSGNTVLHVFGRWLFDAIQLNRANFDEGTAIAVRVMCDIFLQRHTTEFLSVYLANFYSCLQRALLLDGRVLVSAILNSQSLFACRLAGFRVLLPAFLYAVTRIMKRTVSSYTHITRQEVVRHACIRIVASLLCMPNYFGSARFMHAKIPKLDTPLPKSDPNATFLKIFDAQKYEDLKPRLGYLLLESLKSEKHGPNVQELVNLCFIYQCEDIHNDADFAAKSLALILRSVVQHKWTPAVSLIALGALGRMSTLYAHLGETAADQASTIVSQLCAYCMEQVRLSLGQKGEARNNAIMLVEEAFRTVTDWAVTPDQWLLARNNVIRRLMDAVVVATLGCRSAESPDEEFKDGSGDGGDDDDGDHQDGKKDRGKEKREKKSHSSSPNSRIRRAARYALDTILTRLGAFPTPRGGPSSVSSVLAEEQYLLDLRERAAKRGEEAPDVKQYLRVFLLEHDLLVTVIDRPYDQDGGSPFCTIIVRSPTGRYSWDCQRVYLPLSSRLTGASRSPERCAVPVPVTSEPLRRSEKPVELEELSTVLDWFKRHPKGQEIADLAYDQHKAECDHLAQVQYHLNLAITVQPPAQRNPYEGAAKFQSGRMLAAHLGWLSLESWSQVRLVDLSTSLFSDLRALDQTPERECYRVGVVYCAANQRDYGDMLKNQAGSADYQEFVSSLGWGINPTVHSGFLGGLDHKPSGSRSLIHGNVAPYYADHRGECIFHVASLMPTNQAQDEQPHKTRLIANDYVCVVWCEGDLDRYRPTWGKCTLTHIVIKPLLTSLYRIRIVCKGGFEASVGPLVSGAMVSKNILGMLVRETAMRACRVGHARAGGDDAHRDPYSSRRKRIVDITKKYTPQYTELEQFYSGVCGTVSGSQQAPSLSSVMHVPLSNSFRTAATSGGKGTLRETKIQLGSRPSTTSNIPAAAAESSLSPRSGKHRSTTGEDGSGSSSSKHRKSAEKRARRKLSRADSSTRKLSESSGNGNEEGSTTPVKPSRSGHVGRGLAPHARGSGGDTPPPKPSRPPRS